MAVDQMGGFSKKTSGICGVSQHTASLLWRATPPQLSFNCRLTSVEIAYGCAQDVDCANELANLPVPFITFGFDQRIKIADVLLVATTNIEYVVLPFVVL
jgi:hypothetical protein